MPRTQASSKQYGERGIALDKTRIGLHRSRLGLRILGTSFLAMSVSILVFLGFQQLGNHIKDTAIFQNMVIDGYMAEVLDKFQGYIEENEIESTDYIDIQIWLSTNTGIGLLFDEQEHDEETINGQLIHFSDRSIWALPYVTSTQSSGIINLVSVAMAVLCFLIIMARFIRGVISDIKHLSRDMIALSGGDLNHEVHLSGKGELADLAQNIDEMRKSVIEQIKRENEAIAANHELITALSHDLRTPLTKQMGFLEYALNGKCGELNPQMESCLQKIHKATCDLKERSEELFSYAIVFNEQEDTTRVTEVIDGQFLLGQLLDEQTSYLESKGFEVNSMPIQTPFMLNVVVPALSRIFDNITSNIVKYASREHAIQTYCIQNDERVFVHFENIVRPQIEALEGTHIGFRSASKLAETMGGSLHTETVTNRYYAILELPRLAHVEQ